jgi:predicted nucleic acid-binding Zn ribbon protein
MINRRPFLFIGFLFSLLIVFSGCASLQDFSQRKYMPGHFWDNAQRNSPDSHSPAVDAKDNYAGVHPKRDSAESLQKNTPVTQPDLGRNSIPADSQTVNRKSSENALAGVPHRVKKSNSKADQYPPDYEELERESKKAFWFGLLSLVLVTFFFVSWISAAIAIINAGRVINNEDANEIQRARARQGRNMAIISLLIQLFIVILVFLLVFYIFSGGFGS